MHPRLRKAVDYRTCHFADTSTGYNHFVSKHIAKKAKRMTAQMKPNIFNPFDPISIIAFLEIFKPASNFNEVREGAVMWLYHSSMNKTSSAVLNARLSAERTVNKHSRSASCTPRYFNTYTQLFDLSFKKYVTDDFIANTNFKVARFSQPSGTMPSDMLNS